jgi:hypothetical protein
LTLKSRFLLDTTAVESVVLLMDHNPPQASSSTAPPPDSDPSSPKLESPSRGSSIPPSGWPPFPYDPFALSDDEIQRQIKFYTEIIAQAEAMPAAPTPSYFPLAPFHASSSDGPNAPDDKLKKWSLHDLRFSGEWSSDESSSEEGDEDPIPREGGTTTGGGVPDELGERFDADRIHRGQNNFWDMVKGEEDDHRA